MSIKMPNVIADDDMDFVRFGRASLIPGILKSIEFLQAMVFDLQVQIAAAEGNARAVVDLYASDATEVPDEAAPLPLNPPKPAVKKAATKKTRGKGSGVAAYWARMTDEEKSAEMRRRGLAGKKKNPNHPGNPKHPGHSKWLRNVAKGREKAKAARAAAA